MTTVHSSGLGYVSYAGDCLARVLLEQSRHPDRRAEILEQHGIGKSIFR